MLWCVDPSPDVPPPDELGELVAGLLQSCELRRVGQPRGPLGCIWLDEQPHVVELGELPRTEVPQVDARLRTMLDEPLGLEREQRLTDRAAGKAQILGEHAMREFLSGPDLAAEQHRAKPGIRVGMRVDTTTPAGWHEEFPQGQRTAAAADRRDATSAANGSCKAKNPNDPSLSRQRDAMELTFSNGPWYPQVFGQFAAGSSSAGYLPGARRMSFIPASLDRGSDTPADAKPPAGVTLLPTRVALSSDGGTVLAGDIAGRLHAWPTK